MNRKPLPELMKQAERILSIEKTAAPVVSDEVFAIAEVLASAGDLAKVAGDEQATFEKIAIAVNRLAAEKQIEELKKMAAFTKSAASQGYSKEQIEEAVNKIAASHLKKNLGLMSALSASGLGMHDVNALEKRPIKAGSTGEASRRLPLMHSAGGAR